MWWEEDLAISDFASNLPSTGTWPQAAKKGFPIVDLSSVATIVPSSFRNQVKADPACGPKFPPPRAHAAAPMRTGRVDGFDRYVLQNTRRMRVSGAGRYTGAGWGLSRLRLRVLVRAQSWRSGSRSAASGRACWFSVPRACSRCKARQRSARISLCPILSRVSGDEERTTR